MSSSLHTPAMPLLKRLYREYLRDKLGRLLMAAVCMAVAAAATAAMALLMEPVLDDIFGDQNARMLRYIPIVVLSVACMKGLAIYGHTVLMQVTGQRVIADMQQRLFAHLMVADLAFFHEQASGRLISRFTNDITLMRDTLTKIITGLVRESLSLVFLLAVMLYQSTTLTAITLLVLPLAVFPVARLGQRMRRVSRNTQAELGLFTAQLDEIFRGVRIVKAYTREADEIRHVGGLIESLFALYRKATVTRAAVSPLMETLGGVAAAAVIFYGGTQVLEGETTPGAFFSFMTALMMAYKPAKSLANLNTNLQEGLAAAERFFTALDSPATIRDAADARTLTVTRGNVRFTHVNFDYGNDTPVIRDFSLNVPAGKTVALVGPSGSGKSTVMNLIPRFYEPQSGSITIDGQDIREVTQTSLRAHIALVTQETILFDDTVRANIAYSRPGATEGDILAASKAAVAHEFIVDLPQGYDTRIGQYGVRLSGGQRQRLAIARAMLHNAPILLLDEATSALDPIAERQVQEALERLMQGRTTLVIAHRLTTIENADKICVMDAGRIIEAGAHAELLQRRGLYYGLHHSQRLT